MDQFGETTPISILSDIMNLYDILTQAQGNHTPVDDREWLLMQRLNYFFQAIAADVEAQQSESKPF